ncbi:hypothetical protein V1508DRAFT_442406 [Lipomyces doorenjongii]|uniref:uncharacterized protein n=1 Tax=Lipomyces doorenjongii TaxID=383834 RepID=UPI0034CDABE2
MHQPQSMATQRPQYYRNTLQPIRIDRETLLKTVNDLRQAVRYGSDLIQTGMPQSDDWDGRGIYNGSPVGIALAFLRLERQAPYLGERDESSLDFRRLASQFILPKGPQFYPQPRQLSPIGSSPLAATVIRILASISNGDVASGVSEDDIFNIQSAVALALELGPVIHHKSRDMGSDEVLYGRAGLLWALLNIRIHVFDAKTTEALLPVFEAVPRLVDVIIQAGRQGSRDFAKIHGEQHAFPLMWVLHEGYYGLGAVHGITGILTVLLGCRLEELDDGAARIYLPWIASTITEICRICIFNNGHLPTSIPSRPSSRPFPLVQICHGSPAILLLLACARTNAYLTSNFWQPEWDEAIRLASERIWEEGLLSKGGGLCHGMAGNAWPLLLLHDCFEYEVEQMEEAKRNVRERTKATTSTSNVRELSSDYFLSRALAFLLRALETPPYSRALSSHRYRMPDSPFSLFEGLAGTLCAWTEACVVIQARLRKMELEEEHKVPSTPIRDDEVFKRLMLLQLGFPGLGGKGPRGLL